mmetsp:Transcript_23798/g.54037  ORF Transcript_23798/g.54037 Transcript_23798/m.54037 type:complete len:233 (+) Transcript_23798:303-1001(+)
MTTEVPRSAQTSTPTSTQHDRTRPDAIQHPEIRPGPDPTRPTSWGNLTVEQTESVTTISQLPPFEREAWPPFLLGAGLSSVSPWANRQRLPCRHSRGLRAKSMHRTVLRRGKSSSRPETPRPSSQLSPFEPEPLPSFMLGAGLSSVSPWANRQRLPCRHSRGPRAKSMHRTVLRRGKSSTSHFELLSKRLSPPCRSELAGPFRSSSCPCAKLQLDPFLHWPFGNDLQRAVLK